MLSNSKIYFRNASLRKPSLTWICSKNRRIRSSYKERMVDALALGAEEGRDKLRKATGNRK